jgi:hypothetical protein
MKANSKAQRVPSDRPGKALEEGEDIIFVSCSSVSCLMLLSIDGKFVAQIVLAVIGVRPRRSVRSQPYMVGPMAAVYGTFVGDASSGR